MKKIFLLALLMSVPRFCIAQISSWDRIQVATGTYSSLGYSAMLVAPDSTVNYSILQYTVSCSTNAIGTQFSFAQTDNKLADILTSTHIVSNAGLEISPFVPNGLISVPKGKPFGFVLGTSGQSCGVDIRYVSPMN